jgi:Transposase DDE domain
MLHTVEAATLMPSAASSPCTSSGKGRRLSLYPRELAEAIHAARTEQQDGTWQRDYALRAGIEGTIRQATHTTGLRRARYRGLAKTHLDHTTSAAALNLIRLHAWWNGHPLDRAKHSHLARLQLTLSA